MLQKQPLPSKASKIKPIDSLVKFRFQYAEDTCVRICIGNVYERIFRREEQPFFEQVVVYEQFLEPRNLFVRI